MKKLTALFIGCIMITGAFASCGKDSGDSSSKKNSDPVAGKWLMTDDEDGLDMTMDFNDGKLKVEMDLSNTLHFEGKNFVVSGNDMGADNTKFEDGKLSVDMNGSNLLTMTRTEGEGDSLDGTYNELGGQFFEADNSGTEMSARIEGSKFFISYDKFCDYEIDGDETIILKNPPASLLGDGEEGDAKMTFQVEGDNLTLTDEKGDETKLTKVK
ncbi:MAG: hypothetical protein GXY08_02560 [Ruminococcus sp.]|nr:hypothetical protein [Ruminococcus sp.]